MAKWVFVSAVNILQMSEYGEPKQIQTERRRERESLEGDRRTIIPIKPINVRTDKNLFFAINHDV